MADWDEESFIDRMKAGKIYDTSPMPWTAFQKMKDNDLKANLSFFENGKTRCQNNCQGGYPTGEKLSCSHALI